jgi:hypothetical protein
MNLQIEKDLQHGSNDYLPDFFIKLNTIMSIRSMLLTCAVSALVFSACSDEATDSTPTEFIASESDFAGYSSWTKTTADRVGEDPAGMTHGAHGASDSSILRKIYVKQASAVRSGAGQFPVGTMFAKEMTMAGLVQVVTGMAKRGNSYDASGNDWEYFMIGADGKFIGRGDTLMGGGCKGCHGANAGQDYIFTK